MRRIHPLTYSKGAAEMDGYTLFKLTLLVIVVWFWTVIVVKAVRGQTVTAMLLLLASAALVAFSYMQGWIS